jgi:glycolate oxidase iron-sulfur subunit
MKSGSKKDEGGCVKCGTCNTVCPVYMVTGNEVHTPRGKQHLGLTLQKGERSAHYADIFSKCLLCGACLDVCPRALDTPRLVIDIRSELPKISGLSFLKYVSRKALVHPVLLTGLTRAGAAANSLLGDMLPKESGMRLRLLGFEKGTLQSSKEGYLARIKKETPRQKGSQDTEKPYAVNYFTGCLANHLQPEIAESTQFLVAKATGNNANVIHEQTCCGMAAMASGGMEEALDLAKKNIKAFEENSLPILTSCSSCYYQLKSYCELFAGDPDWLERAKRFAGRVQEFSTYFLNKFSEISPAVNRSVSQKGQKVFYHDPCHLRFKLQMTREPRDLLKLFKDVDLQELPGGPQCCGHGGLFQLAHPDLAQQVQERLMKDFASLQVNSVVTACSGCLLQWQLGLRTKEDDGKALHLAVFIARLLQ